MLAKLSELGEAEVGMLLVIAIEETEETEYQFEKRTWVMLKYTVLKSEHLAFESQQVT